MLAFCEEIEKSFPILEKLFNEDELNDFMKCNYDELYTYHFGLGLWIRNNLLDENEQLYKCLLNSGVMHKDNMSDLIIKLFYIQMRRKYK